MAHELVETFIRPWLAEHHPHADVVLMPGSYGRAMASGGYLPVASSDVDLLIIYSDLRKGGFRAATQVASVEDVGAASGGLGRLMTMDTNIFDLASLHYHDHVVRESTHFVQLHRMIVEGYVLLDRLGIAPVLRAKAVRFVAEGPPPVPRGRWKETIDRLREYRDAILVADSGQDRRLVGVLALFHVCGYALGLHQYWRERVNQSYRRLTQFFPEEERAITDAFSALIRHDRAEGAVALLDDYLRRGTDLLAGLPEADRPQLYPAEEHLPKDEAAAMRDMFIKFMMSHLCDALETSRGRGELAHLENLSTTLFYAKAAVETREAVAPVEGTAALGFLAAHLPGIISAALRVLDEGDDAALREVADGLLADRGGLGFTRIENYYLHDAARIHALGAAGDGFRPAFLP